MLEAPDSQIRPREGLGVFYMVSLNVEASAGKIEGVGDVIVLIARRDAEASS